MDVLIAVADEGWIELVVSEDRVLTRSRLKVRGYATEATARRGAGVWSDWSVWGVLIRALCWNGQIRNTQRQYMRTKLPTPEADVWSLLVNGVAAKPSQDHDHYHLIPLEKSGTWGVLSDPRECARM